MAETPHLQTRIDAATVTKAERRALAVYGRKPNMAHLARAGIVAIGRGKLSDAELLACLKAAEMPTGRPAGRREST